MTKQLGLRAAAGEPGLDRGGAKQLVEIIRGRLDGDDLAWLDEALADYGNWSDRRIATVLSQAGHPLSASAVGNYRNLKGIR